MAGKKSFTLMEIIVTLMVIGVLAAISIPAYNTFVQNGASQAAANNLSAIYGAEQNYYFKKGTYCVNTGSNPTCADTLPDINANLSLNVTDNYYSYSCAMQVSSTNAICCSATANNSNFPAVASKCGGTCTPNCVGAVCGASDGCGGTCLSGSCTGTNTCGGGGTSGVCGCTPSNNCSISTCSNTTCNNGCVQVPGTLPPVNGACTAWGPCSSTCANTAGIQTCTASNPQCGGSSAVGTTQTCTGGGATVNGACTAWGPCSSTCNNVAGTQSCTSSTSPQCGGSSAVGTTQSCTGGGATVNGVCTAWGPCSSTCNNVAGTQSCTSSTSPQCGGSPAPASQACYGSGVPGCDGTCDGSVNDACGKCGGSGAECCSNSCGGNTPNCNGAGGCYCAAGYDCVGTCGGSNVWVDCFGIRCGTSVLDSCGVCNGNGTTCGGDQGGGPNS